MTKLKKNFLERIIGNLTEAHSAYSTAVLPPNHNLCYWCFEKDESKQGKIQAASNMYDIDKMQRQF